MQQEVIPYRPIPPAGAAYSLDIPPIGPDGIRLTLNSNLDESERIWHFRSVWNVAALNCLDADHEAILTGYGAFLKKYSKRLTATNSAIEKKFRKEYRTDSEARKAREAHMTQVYNYFAMPAVIGDMCNVALQVANEASLTPIEDLSVFATASLPRFEAAYENFFRAYEQYRIGSTAWDARYGERYGYSQPGYVAIYGSAGPSVATSLAAGETSAIVSEVIDPETGARIPVLNLPDSATGTPVVQPVPQE